MGVFGMLVLKTVEATKWGKCTCCGEQWRTCESYLVVFNTDTGRNVRGERYCTECADYAFQNNDGLVWEGQEAETRERDAERERETYGAYLVAGCPQQYFEDRQAGY